MDDDSEADRLGMTPGQYREFTKARDDDTQRIMSAAIDSLTEDERRVRWQVLEARLEEAEQQAAAALAEMQAFARRCVEVDTWRRTRETSP